jgi:uncharacterized protein
VPHLVGAGRQRGPSDARESEKPSESDSYSLLPPSACFLRYLYRVRTFAVLRATCVALVLCARPAALAAQQPALPAPVGYVNDFAGVLSSEAKSRLESLAERLNAATRGDMVVVTLPDLGGRPVEEVALRLGREWKVGADAVVGDRARNAGIVILIVPKESAADGRGRCRIEVGQGAEGFVTDATAGTLCRDVTAQFVARDYSGAIEYLAGTVAMRYAAEYGVTLDGQPRQSRGPSSTSSDDPTRFIVLLVIIVIFLMLSSRRGRRSGCVGCIPIPGPSMGGGFGGGFGGGGFGGGGGGGGFGGFGGGGGFSGGGGGSDW